MIKVTLLLLKIIKYLTLVMSTFKFIEYPNFKILNWFVASDLLFEYTIFDLIFKSIDNDRFEIYLPNGNYYITI